MNYFIKLTLFILIILISTFAWADTISSPHIYITKFEFRDNYYFKMIPGKDFKDLGRGICYKITKNDTDEILWRTNGWYSYEVHLSQDGKYLVRMGDWPSGEFNLNSKDIAVAFYKEGNLLKMYYTSDLIKNPSSVHHSISHYQWRDYNEKNFNMKNNKFYLSTIEGITYIFDITTGNILDKIKSNEIE
ncbi:MAG: hypothetical protein AABZ74_08675 [Cyanobacteriota bacterium]